MSCQKNHLMCVWGVCVCVCLCFAHTITHLCYATYVWYLDCNHDDLFLGSRPQKKNGIKDSESSAGRLIEQNANKGLGTRLTWEANQRLSSPGCHQNQGLLTLSRLRPGLQLAGNRRFLSPARVLSACLPSRPALQKVSRGAVVRNDIKDFPHPRCQHTTGQANRASPQAARQCFWRSHCLLLERDWCRCAWLPENPTKTKTTVSKASKQRKRKLIWSPLPVSANSSFQSLVILHTRIQRPGHITLLRQSSTSPLLQCGQEVMSSLEIAAASKVKGLLPSLQNLLLQWTRRDQTRCLEFSRATTRPSISRRPVWDVESEKQARKRCWAENQWDVEPVWDIWVWETSYHLTFTTLASKK